MQKACVLCDENIRKFCAVSGAGSEFAEFCREKYGIAVLTVDNIDDSWHCSIRKSLAAVNNFGRTQMGLDDDVVDIEDKKTSRIVFNCYAGLNRSAACAAAFLMEQTGMPLVDVLGLMVSGRLVYGGILRKKRWGYNGVQSRFLRDLIDGIFGRSLETAATV